MHGPSLGSSQSREHPRSAPRPAAGRSPPRGRRRWQRAGSSARPGEDRAPRTLHDPRPFCARRRGWAPAAPLVAGRRPAWRLRQAARLPRPVCDGPSASRARSHSWRRTPLPPRSARPRQAPDCGPGSGACAWPRRTPPSCLTARDSLFCAGPLSSPPAGTRSPPLPPKAPVLAGRSGVTSSPGGDQRSFSTSSSTPTNSIVHDSYDADAGGGRLLRHRPLRRDPRPARASRHRRRQLTGHADPARPAAATDLSSGTSSCPPAEPPPADTSGCA